jgi:hypothetical protein
VVFFQARGDFVGDRFELRLGSGRADDKEIGEGGEPAQVEQDNFFGLLVRGQFGAGPG